MGEGMDGGYMPLPTSPQRYCDPASLVYSLVLTHNINVFFFVVIIALVLYIVINPHVAMPGSTILAINIRTALKCHNSLNFNRREMIFFFKIRIFEKSIK